MINHLFHGIFLVDDWVYPAWFNASNNGSLENSFAKKCQVMKISTPISAHSAGLVVPKATPQMLACIQTLENLTGDGKDSPVVSHLLLITWIQHMNAKCRDNMVKSTNLWHHKVPGVDVNTTSAANHHHPGKDWYLSMSYWGKFFCNSERRGFKLFFSSKIKQPCLGW